MYTPTLYGAPKEEPVQKQLHLSDEENAELVKNINQLIANTSNACNASLPLMAAAELSDEALYKISLNNIRDQLTALDNDTTNDQSIAWMKNNAFKAWMWGRVLLSAKNMDDKEALGEAQDKLDDLLKAERTADDNPAFIAWARAYLAAFNVQCFNAENSTMLTEGDALSRLYLTSNKHDDLSNALWVWVMDIQAAALANNAQAYETIKTKMKAVASSSSVASALSEGLTRTESSNDYPAWAMAKVMLAAAHMGDEALVAELREPVRLSIKDANDQRQVAEATLARLDERIADSLDQDQSLTNRRMSHGF